VLEGTAPRLVAAKRIWRPTLTAAGLQQLTAALLAAALMEALLLRLVTRVGVHLPKEGVVTAAFQAASFLGSLAFNFASLLAIALVVLVLASLVLRMQSGVGRLALAALSAAMLWGLGVSLVTDAPAADAVFGLAAALLVALVPVALGLLQGASHSEGEAASATLTCTVKASCSGGEVAVFRMSGTANAHAQTAATATYGQVVCCSGPGALSNRSGRFEAYERQPIDNGWSFMNHDGGEGEPPAALDHLGHAVDADQFLDKFGLLARRAAVP